MGKKKKLKEDREYIKTHAHDMPIHELVEAMMKNRLYVGKPIISSEEAKRIKKEADDEMELTHFLFGAKSTRPPAGEGLRWQDEPMKPLSPEFKKLCDDIKYNHKHKYAGYEETMNEPKKCYTIEDCENIEDRLLLILRNNAKIENIKLSIIIANLLRILEIEKYSDNTKASNHIIDCINNIAEVFESIKED